jgi:hypothetical protein
MVKNKSPLGEKFTKSGESAEGVFAAEVLDPLPIDLKESSRGGLIVLGATESSGEECDLQLLDFCVEVCTGFG